MKFVYDREKIRDIKSRYVQRLRINIEPKDDWRELYKIENSYFLKTTSNIEIYWIRISKEVADMLLSFDEKTFYNEAGKHLELLKNV